MPEPFSFTVPCDVVQAQSAKLLRSKDSVPDVQIGLRQKPYNYALEDGATFEAAREKRAAAF